MRIIILLLTLLISQFAFARDNGQWDNNSDPVTKNWYKSLERPDAPGSSCCGEADAYWSDLFEATPDGNYIAIITDTRDDAPLGRPHRSSGTKVVIPKEKMKIDAGNPTGHGIVFLAFQRAEQIEAGEAPYVYCYVTGTLG